MTTEKKVNDLCEINPVNLTVNQHWIRKLKLPIVP